jgi:hypothetical protein
MSMVRYFVFHSGKQWLITLDGDLLSRHPSRAAAVKSAAVMADLMGAMHHEADVMVESEAGLAVAWTYGSDAVPVAEQAA